ncbi:NAD(P)-dependent oxidoreductase [Pseudolabrys taiwanensis]|uniref:NAD(P)-dependent oxidoreductase n=1 Tax=Pseudolabrys taiwanensis TaxID=331696 RepID=A0A345ZX60_9HYPH|nr:NAD(P)-dependent oxidoreductase [Pseudolabrys taiwanensis]AXK81507.1 NAD(P)-dependent oxidoreductase [Pseudolabrys taiwanensis]
MKVLITGGMGVIGAETSRKFVREGHRPVVFARHREDRLISDIVDKIDFEAGDIVDMPRLLGVIKEHKVSHIVHAAAFVGAVSAANPALSIQVNVMGTVNVLEAARLFDVKRVVFTSAKGIYGPVLGEYGPPHYKPMPEDMPKNPQRIYDSAKLMAEQTTLYYANSFGVDAAIVRFATTYGPGKTARHGKMGVTSQIVENPFHGLPFIHPYGAEAKDDFIYNKDSALGIYLATVAEKVPSRVYNIGSGVGVGLNDIAAAVRKRIPGAKIEIGPGDNFLGMPYPPHGVYDVSRAHNELGFKPEYDVERAVADYVDSLERMRAQGI